MLSESRYLQADNAFQGFDFLTEVEGCDGWESIIPGDEMTRKVWLFAEDQISQEVTFTVRFTPHTDKIAEVYAITQNGNLIGASSAVTEQIDEIRLG